MFPLEQGAFEMLLIGAIALIVVGPKDLPIVMRKVGQFTAKLRGMAAEFRASFDEMARQSELDDLRREVEALRSGSYLTGGAPAPFAPQEGQTALPSAGETALPSVDLTAPPLQPEARTSEAPALGAKNHRAEAGAGSAESALGPAVPPPVSALEPSGAAGVDPPAPAAPKVSRAPRKATGARADAPEAAGADAPPPKKRASRARASAADPGAGAGREGEP